MTTLDPGFLQVTGNQAGDGGQARDPGDSETDPECGPTTAKGVSSTRKCGPRLAVTWSAGWWASGRRGRESDGGGR